MDNVINWLTSDEEKVNKKVRKKATPKVVETVTKTVVDKAVEDIIDNIDLLDDTPKEQPTGLNFKSFKTLGQERVDTAKRKELAHKMKRLALEAKAKAEEESSAQLFLKCEQLKTAIESNVGKQNVLVKFIEKTDRDNSTHNEIFVSDCFKDIVGIHLGKYYYMTETPCVYSIRNVAEKVKTALEAGGFKIINFEQDTYSDETTFTFKIDLTSMYKDKD